MEYTENIEINQEGGIKSAKRIAGAALGVGAAVASGAGILTTGGLEWESPRRVG